jgi:aspartate 1-decarboxylase
MFRTFLQAKLHRVCVTRADLHYEGSCGIDARLLEAAGMAAFQHIEIYNVTNGQRFTTYIIEAPAESGEISLNGAAARCAAVGDLLIICTYGTLSEQEARDHRPVVVLVDEKNRLRERRVAS